MTNSLILPVYDLDGNVAGRQIREPGKPPLYRPKGIEMKKCSPYIGRITDSPIILVCEGPTDVISCMEVRGLESWSILGCWSATTLPPESFWVSGRLHGKNVFIACGDNDDSGRAFNQGLANAVGSTYVVRWPSSFRHKGDARDYISEYGSSAFTSLARRSLSRELLLRKQNIRKSRPSTSHIKPSVSISELLLVAGGEFRYAYGEGNQKWLCPLHNDVEDPSFTLNEENGSWKCWAGCGQGGPPQFIMAWKNVDFKSALELMKKYV